MEATDQAAEQVVRITLAGGETAVRLTGAAAADVAAALAAAAASGGRTKGRARLQTMLRTGRELRVFQLPREQLGGFAREARRYGVLYAVVRGEGDGPADLIVKAEDASKINRIAERLSLGTVEPEAPVPEGAPPRGAPGPSRDASDVVGDLLGKRREVGKDPLAREGPGNRSGPSSGSGPRSGRGSAEVPHRSVRAEMRAIERERSASGNAPSRARARGNRQR